MSLHAIAPAESAGPNFTALPPLSLYVHLPWCVRKCPYCDFNSYEARGPLADIEYVDAVLRDLRSELPNVQGRHVQTVFIGGGTPSLFSAAAIERLLRGIAADLTLARDAEITLEANPGAVDAARFAAFRAAGVNRLSIGIQSLRDDRLRALGRVHDSREARRAVELARTAGFTNINLDFMYALPDDDAAGALADLEQAVELAPAHLVVVPAHARAEHCVRAPPAAVARGRDRDRDRDARQGAARCGGLRSLRDFGVFATGAPVRAQPELLAASGTIWAWGPVRTARSRCRTCKR